MEVKVSLNDTRGGCADHSAYGKFAYGKSEPQCRFSVQESVYDASKEQGLLASCFELEHN